MLSIFKKRPLINNEVQEHIVAAVKEAEKKTSGEIRVYVESHCRFVDPLDRAKEIFFGLKMEHTEHRNGVIVYVAIKDRQAAIFADEGIYAAAGQEFWDKEMKMMLLNFKEDHLEQGIISCVRDLGELLVNVFPYHHEDRNELPDEIVFGK